MNSKLPRPAERSSARGSPAPESRGPQQRQPQSATGGRWGSFYRNLASLPGLDYLMIRITVLLLAGIGVVIVLSSSMTWSYIEGSGVWGTGGRQAAMVAVGFAAFWVALKIHPSRIRKFAPWLLAGTFVIMIAVLTPLGVGREEVGAQSWLSLGPLQLQPSEVAKVVIAVWGAGLLADNSRTGRGWGNPFTKFSLVATALALLNLLQGDLGTTLSFAATVVVLLIFAGVRMQWVWGMMIAAGLGSIALVLMGRGFRSARVEVFFNSLFGKFEDTQGQAFQSYQGFLSLADGSVFGVGLGQSRAKWFYLPEAKNDFIFAIIGEELGLWGGGLVIVLFGLLGVFGLRTAIRAQDQFQSLLAATLTAGIVSQAFINIGYVIGLLPVTGIQLPMLSSGGTSAIITLGSMGLLANCARHEPDAVSAMQSYGRPLFDRLFFLGEPRPAGGAAEKVSASRTPARFGAPVTQRRPEADRGTTKRAPRGPDPTETEYRQSASPRRRRSVPPEQRHRPGRDESR